MIECKKKLTLAREKFGSGVIATRRRGDIFPAVAAEVGVCCAQRSVMSLSRVELQHLPALGALRIG
jgi:hypothetical protein